MRRRDEDANVVQDALAIIAATPGALRALLAAASDDALSAPLDDGWSPNHVVAHLLDVDTVILVDRITRIVEEDNPFLRSIEPTERMDNRGLAGRPIAENLRQLGAERPARVEHLGALTTEQLARPGEHDVAGPITAQDLIHHGAYHDLMHLQQVAAMLQAPLVPRMGNTRKFYDL